MTLSWLTDFIKNINSVDADLEMLENLCIINSAKEGGLVVLDGKTYKVVQKIHDEFILERIYS